LDPSSQNPATPLEKTMVNGDKLKRINNVIMYNLEESKSAIVSERHNDDMQFFGSVMEYV